MDFLTLVLLISSILCFFIVLRSKSSSKRTILKHPPGPFAIPVIGNLLQLGQNPHKSLAKLSETYGPIMRLKLGSIHTIVISSPQMAKEILQKNDKICSGRIPPFAAQAMDHHEVGLAFLPIGDVWRKLRKISKEQMFTVHKLKESEGLRQEKIQQLSDYLNECCLSDRVVDIGEVAFVTTLNLLSTTLCSIDFANFDSNSAQELKGIVQSIMKILGTPNLADYFPFLRLFDPQGMKHETGIYFAKLLEKFDEIITTRLQSRGVPKKTDLLELLLDLNQDRDSYLNRNEINHLLLELIVGGTDTTTDTVQWVMTELLRNPQKMLKAKNELRVIVGENKKVKESDISKLSYLNAVIKETFRLHPPGPFLIPHKAEADVEIKGFIVPKDAQILVNTWAMNINPSIWSDPYSFEPERFVDIKIDYRGKDFELVPFGSGRRICPGLPLAHVMVHLIVASMVHEFDWNAEPETLDLNEIFGLSVHKAVPLKAFPIKNT